MSVYQPSCPFCFEHPGWNAADPLVRSTCSVCHGSGVDRYATEVPINTFWGQINHQLRRIIDQRPKSFDHVRAILLDTKYNSVVEEVNRNGVRRFDIDSAFFAGSGGSQSMIEAMQDARWQITTYDTSYHWVATLPRTGAVLTYIEGDVLRGDHINRPVPVPVPDADEAPSEPNKQSNWSVSWTFDVDDEPSAAAAAAQVWKEVFNRNPGQPTNEEACVFTVTDGTTTVGIDLSDPEHAGLFGNSLI